MNKKNILFGSVTVIMITALLFPTVNALSIFHPEGERIEQEWVIVDCDFIESEMESVNGDMSLIEDCFTDPKCDIWTRDENGENAVETYMRLLDRYNVLVDMAEFYGCGTDSSSSAESGSSTDMGCPCER